MIWIIIDHPQQLMTALGLIQNYSISKKNINLLISNHPYHKNIDIDYSLFFNEVVVFKRVNLGRNILKDSLNFFIQKVKVNNISKQIKKDDILIGLSTCQVLENMFLSLKKDIKKIGIITEVQYKYANKDLSDYKQYPRMVIYSPIMKLLGLYQVFNGLLEGYSKKTKDGIDALRYVKNIDKIYDYLFYMVNIDNKTNDYLVKYKNSFKINYLSFKENCKEQKLKEVIFFGNCFYLFENFSKDKYAENTNKFLDYIRYYYNDFHLIYIPHPKETEEKNQLNLSSFDIYEGKLNAELYFQKKYCNIQACFSIASTVTRNALAYNIQSYSFLKVMNFNKQQENYFINLYGNIQDEIFIKDLNKAPKKINLKQINNEILKDILNA